MENSKKHPLIEDYGLIGNLNTTALVSKQGSIDFLSYTRFDSPTIFGALLDREKGGFFSIEVECEQVNHKQLYLPDTAILLTRYLTNVGIAELTDFMPLEEEENQFILVRKLKVIKGNLNIRVELRPRFEYGKYEFNLEQEDDHLVMRSKGPEANTCHLLCNLDFKMEGASLTTEICLSAGDEINFALVSANTEHSESNKSKSLEYYANQSFENTIHFWRNWTNKSTYTGRWRDIVNRSAITLKLLTSCRYGSPIAAATLGLPERIGAERNWDYRYTWIRDAAFTMYSFLRLGYTDEARKFIAWIQQRSLEIDTAEALKLMYRIDGTINLEEVTIPHLEGYQGSDPVRAGNDAFNQFQLDIFGELIDTIYLYNKNAEPISYDFWLSLIKFIDYVCQHWKRKGHGMWEVRDEKREFLISKVMSWVALDRGIRIAENRAFPAPLERWRQTRDDVFNDVFNNFWNPELGAFVQYRGATTLDASALLIPLVRMLSPKEPRWISTLRAIEKELVTDSLVYRYKLSNGASDGLSDDEGTFSMCSFWYIECLAKSGQLEKAILCFEKMLGYANHLGLYSEQISLNGEQLGNFPQAFTHLGLISAAHQLRLLLTQDKMS
ncbi:Glucoamylase (glucan-1,4-alpha-glucosidase), GH15 family [Nitrosomonas aestuarii]|uniref:Glucoamylase (Glucan-1,4-alpha-glucosidase), GH15 family n=1 Tax=Nitrosomonas aestuarii TaxID=52441 RepID=A0A1I3YU79_9PROT|nr:glycoside hydrolase family 15 protein [Nitrosomonas aestuarii]SFK34766.1 Glucoamylase (glucan-1,4-alpha-glucosidase), GH15 family [Nitrosomonas aestuarii]